MEKKVFFSTHAGAYCGLVLTFVLWGSLYVVTKVLLTSIPAFSVAFVRFFIAWLALTAYSHLHRNSAEASPSFRNDRDYRHCVLLLGVGGYGISVGMQLLGTKFAGSTVASLINSLNPVSISLMAAFLLHEQLTWRKILGTALSAFGVFLIIGLGAQVNGPSVMLSLFSVIGWSLVSVLNRRGVTKYGALPVTRDAIGVAACCNLVFCIIESIWRGEIASWTPGALLGVAYMGVVCTGLTYILWNRGLAILPASNCSAFYPIQPLTSALLGILMFGEHIAFSFVVGAACVVAGILICLLKCTPCQGQI